MTVVTIDVDRRRQLFPVFLAAWHDAQPGGKGFNYIHQMRDIRAAYEHMQMAEERLIKVAVQAQVDRHGYPLN